MVPMRTRHLLEQLHALKWIALEWMGGQDAKAEPHVTDISPLCQAAATIMQTMGQ
jgi:hypothetical protein